MCDNEKSEAWTVQLKVDETQTEFKINTGADINMMNEDTFHSLTPERALEPSDLPINSPGGELHCFGCLDIMFNHKKKKNTHPKFMLSVGIKSTICLADRFQ